MFKIILPIILLIEYLTITLQNDEVELFTRTTQALNKSLDFILSEYRNMNMDGILGITETIVHIRKALPKSTNRTTAHTLTQLLNKSELIYDLQTPNLPNFPYKYYVFNNYVLPPQNWERDINYSYGKLNKPAKVDTGPYDVNDIYGYLDYVAENTFSEALSDKCLVEVATASDNTEPHDCPISDECVGYMVTMPTSYLSTFPGYGVTHMALFLKLGRSRNCNFDYDKVDESLRQQCSYILWELEKNVQYGYITTLDDLFFEQVGICGQEGFGEFLKKEYLEHLLETQESHGGYALIFMKRNRAKRESVDMKYGTNSHTTGLAVSMMSLYIRLLIEKPFSGKAFYEAQ